MESALRAVPLFANVDDEALGRVAAMSSERSYGRGEVVISEGEPANGFYVVLEGRVKVYKLSPAGREQVLHVIEANQSFAEAAIFTLDTFPAYAETLVPSRLLFVPRREFLALLESQPRLALQMMASLSAYLHRLTQLIEDLALREAPARLARHLYDLAHESGTRTPEGIAMKLGMPKAELAQRLGITSETLSRALRTFQDEGLLAVRGRTIVVRDAAALQEVAAGLR